MARLLTDTTIYVLTGQADGIPVDIKDNLEAQAALTLKAVAEWWEEICREKGHSYGKGMTRRHCSYCTSIALKAFRDGGWPEVDG